MMLIVTPLKWRRRIDAYSLTTNNAHDVFRKVNERVEGLPNVNITMVNVAPEQLADWVSKNVTPTWWEWVTGHVHIDYWRS